MSDVSDAVDEAQKTIPQANVVTPADVAQSIQRHTSPQDNLQQFVEPSGNAHNGGQLQV